IFFSDEATFHLSGKSEDECLQDGAPPHWSNESKTFVIFKLFIALISSHFYLQP
ncbi:hypothetical protein L9F63_024183, partial [Diploptera punctata]